MMREATSPGRAPIKLRSHLVALILSALLPVLLFASVMVAVFARHERAAVEQGLLETTRALSLAVDTELRRTIAALQVLALSEPLISGDLRRFYVTAQQVLHDQATWANILVVGPSGEHLLNLRKPFGSPLPPLNRPELAVETVRTRHPIISDLVHGSVIARPVVIFTMPVIVGDTVRYVLEVGIESPRWEALLQSRVREGRVGLLLDRQKTFIARTLDGPRMVGKRAADSLTSVMSKAPEGIVSGPTVEGFQAYGAFHTSEFSGWTVDVFVPASVVDGPLRTSLGVVAGGFLALLLSGIGLALVLGRRISQPIGALTRSVHSLGRGEPPSPITSRIAEVDDASRALEDAGALLTERLTREQEARAEAEEAVRQLEATQLRLSRLIGSNLIGVLFANLKGITDANDALLRMLGYTRQDLEDDRLLWERIAPPDHRHADERALAELRERGECAPFEKEYWRRDGTRVPVLVGAALLEDEPLQWISFVVDMSEQRRTREAIETARRDAEAANRAKDEFLAMLGHELRNPIGAIANGVRVLEALGTPHEPGARARAVIVRQVDHLSRLVDDLLDVARVTSGKIILERVPVNLEATVRRCLATLAAAGKTARHAVSLDASPVWVEGDETRLEQILTNLVDNAVKYTPPGGQIRISAGAEGDEAVIRVADTGQGISATLLPRIFDLFVQGAQGLDRGRGGLGIGLSLVRRLVELHGGVIEAASGGPGAGSTFTARLPRTDAPASTSVPASRATVSPRRVLVVEDNQDARLMLTMLLGIAGHEVYEACDGPSGVEAAVAHEPDIALIDIGLPRLDGYETARRIRASKAGAMFLVAVSGYGQAEDRRRTAEAGFDAHLVKPVDAPTLERVIAAAPRRTPPSSTRESSGAPLDHTQ